MQYPAPRILVVEDDRDCRESICDLLELSGFAVTAAEDGVVALGILATDLPDALLADLNMPRMGGEALLREIRRDARLDALPVVVMTGALDPVRPEGAFAVVQKPFAPAELMRTLERALAPAPLAACS